MPMKLLIDIYIYCVQDTGAAGDTIPNLAVAIVTIYKSLQAGSQTVGRSDDYCLQGRRDVE